MKRITLIFSIILLLGLNSKAQDHTYSSFLKAPVYMNPALVGVSNDNSYARLSFINKEQYPLISNAYGFRSFAFDANFTPLMGGIGIMLDNSNEGDGFYQKNQASIVYAFKGNSFDRRKNRKFEISAAMQVSIASRSVNYSNLIFYDQLNIETGFDPSLISEAQNNANEVKVFPDFSFGLCINKTIRGNNFIPNGRLNLGASVHHLNQPDESLISTKSILDRRYTIHGTFVSSIKRGAFRNATFFPSFCYTRQSDLSILNVGFQTKFKQIVLGGWYKQGRMYNASQVAVFSLSYDLNAVNFAKKIPVISIGCSTDFMIKGLGAQNTGNAFEFFILYQFSMLGNKPCEISEGW
jgi:type IX secretion system PorP/SprF family membrane protein